MSEQVGPYRVVDLSPARRAWLNMLDLSGPTHCMYGLLEVDVTVARQFIAEHKARTGETLSFTGFLVFCLARAVDEDKAVPPSRGMPTWFRSAMLLPWPLSRLLKALLGMATRRDPTIFTSMAGTVGISAIGMFGKGHSGWGIYSPTHSLELVVGSTAWKPTVVEGRIEPREILHLTVVFDHDVSDWVWVFTWEV